MRQRESKEIESEEVWVLAAQCLYFELDTSKQDPPDFQFEVAFTF
ncbi:MAG: hypothetical protein AAGG48_07995 [Planctomycetota bacterium]